MRQRSPGCGGTKAEKKREDFFTSGNREADQRATQRIYRSAARSSSITINVEGRTTMAK